MNFVDLIILVSVALFLYIGYLRGFIRDFAGLLVLLGALWLATVAYVGVGAWLTSTFGLPEGLAITTGFFLVWFVIELIYFILVTFFYDKIPENWRNISYNRWFGLLPAFARSVLFIWFTINLVFLFAVSGTLKQQLDDSFFARQLTKNNQVVSNFVSRTFGPSATDAARFLTVQPDSGESIQLGYTTKAVTVDTASAKEMLTLLNKERKANGLRELTLDDKLIKVGEAHCRNMFAEGYFSHNTPDGKTPFDRMNAAGINFLIAGENLALAPTVNEAFAGLMDSPGHKANMLSPEFGRVGIAVIDGGKYGKMFAQEFTN